MAEWQQNIARMMMQPPGFKPLAQRVENAADSVRPGRRCLAS
jgi:hypothetical protein